MVLASFAGSEAQEGEFVTLNGGPSNCQAAVQASGGCVFKTQGAHLFAFQVQNWSATAVNVFVLDATAIPGSGSVTPLLAFALPAGTTSAPTEIDRFAFPTAIITLNGLVIVCSTQTALSGGNVQFAAAASACTFSAGYH